MSAASKVGSGLVEISAVATIIGAPVAEMLMHGLKGASGMAWAPMSTFGAIHVTKACLAAVVPDFLRESTGLRNHNVDAAIGVAVPVDPSKRAKNRVDLGDARAIQAASSADNHYICHFLGRKPLHWSSVRSSQHSSDSWKLPSQRDSGTARRKADSVYVLDKSASLALDTVYGTTAERGEAVPIHRFEPDFAGLAPVWRDWLCITLSTLKLLEGFALWKLGAITLWYWTCLGWSHAFVAAVLLQLSGLGRDGVLLKPNDIVAGTLPTPLHLGGHGKIVLQVPANVRRHLLWRIALGSGVLFNAAGLFGTFLFLGKEPSIVIYTWVGFQGLWLLSRSVIFYFVEGAAAARQGVMLSMSWEDASDEDRQRVLNLLEALSMHQVSIHPRGVLAYQRDCLDFSELSSQFDEADWNLTMQLPYLDTESKVWKINIKAVSGDPVVRSVVWQTGADLDNSELYDATVAFVQVGAQTVAIPCVRVWACDCLPTPDTSRGNAHPDCGLIKWLYFIPFAVNDKTGWIVAHGVRATGLLLTEILSSEEIDRRFRHGRYRISMQKIEDLERALDVARKGVIITRDLLKSAAKDRQPLRERSKTLETVTVEDIGQDPRF